MKTQCQHFDTVTHTRTTIIKHSQIWLMVWGGVDEAVTEWWGRGIVLAVRSCLFLPPTQVSLAESTLCFRSYPNFLYYFCITILVIRVNGIHAEYQIRRQSNLSKHSPLLLKWNSLALPINEVSMIYQHGGLRHINFRCTLGQGLWVRFNRKKFCCDIDEWGWPIF